MAVIVVCLASLIVVIDIALPKAVTAQPPPPGLKDSQARWWMGDLPPVVRAGLSNESLTPLASPTDTSTRLSAGVADWSRLAFQSFRDGNWEIYLAQSDGSQPVRLTNHPAADLRPRLNRGATRVVFSSNRDGALDIYIQSTDGSGLTRLTVNSADDASPVWSPDGHRIAFASERDGNWEIYVMNTDGSAQTRLTYDDSDDLLPTWSPDGTQIAWVRRRGTDGALWVMNADGSGAHPITGMLRFLQTPDWSPDGSRLAFDYDADGDYWNDLALINTDGTGLQTVYNLSYDLIDVWMGSWSPDGEWLVFTRVEYGIRGDDLVIRNTYLERMPATGGSVQRLITAGVDVFPDWEATDANPPQSHLEPLPPYSRAMGLPVRWSGTDTGPAGIASYDVQYRIGTTGPWTDWQMGTTATSAVYSAPAGTVVSFRGRARDKAGNVEAWPTADGAETSTTLYTWQLSGQVTDNRGVPLAGVPVMITPSPLRGVHTNFQGHYLARLTAEGPHTFEVGHNGYAPVPPLSLNVDSDRLLNLYLPPQDNLIENGGFEADAQQLAGWVVSGELAVTVTDTDYHTGLRAAALGQPCPAPCLSIPQPIPNVQSTLAPSELAIDSSGNVHVVWWGFGQGVGRVVYHSTRTPDGLWTAPRVIGNDGGFSSTVRVGLAVDGQDTLHAVWNGSAGLYYSQRPASGDWTSPVVLGPGHEPDVAADSRGGIHVIYQCYGAGCPGEVRTYYLARLPAGTWEAPVPVGTGNGYFGPKVTVGPDDTVHFLWFERGPYASDTGIFYRARSPDGILIPLEKLFDGYANQQAIVVDTSGRVHVFWASADDYTGYYTTRAPGGTWTDPVAVPRASLTASMTVDNQSVLHMITAHWPADGRGTEGTYYRRKAPGKVWSDPILISTQPSERAIAFDPYGVVHMVWPDAATLFHQTRRTSAQGGAASIGQTVTVPTDQHEPTLAFMYKLSGAVPANGAGFTAQVTDEVTTTQVFSATTSVPWSLGSVDLRPWAGQTVSVIFTTRQATGTPSVRLLLDDVSLGAWLTPVIRAVTPSRVEPQPATSITITGENFVETPTVRLNETPMNDVQWVDEHTLQVTLPAGLPPGVYSVWVTNPGGQEAVLPRGLRIGQQVYLPVLFRGYAP